MFRGNGRPSDIRECTECDDAVDAADSTVTVDSGMGVDRSWRLQDYS